MTKLISNNTIRLASQSQSISDLKKHSLFTIQKSQEELKLSGNSSKPLGNSSEPEPERQSDTVFI